MRTANNGKALLKTKPIILLICIAMALAGGCRSTSRISASTTDYIRSIQGLDIHKRVDAYQIKISDIYKQYNAGSRLSALADASRFAEAILLHKDYDGIDILEETSDKSIKEAVWLSARRTSSLEARTLLKKWAIRNPSERSLWSFHPEGELMCREVIQDATSSVYAKAACIRTLGHMNATNSIGFLKELVDDRREVPQYQARWNEDPETLGNIASDAINRIQGITDSQ